MRFDWFYRWWWRLRLDRVERLQSRLQKGLSPRVVWDARLIDRLIPEELREQREAQAEKRYRKDAIYSLGLEAFRLKQLLMPELEIANSDEVKE